MRRVHPVSARSSRKKRALLRSQSARSRVHGAPVRVAFSDPVFPGGRRIEEALEESRERYRLLVDSINKAIFIVQDGLVKFVNPMAVEIFAYPEKDILETPFIDFIHPDDREMVVDCYARRIGGDKFPTRYEFRAAVGGGDTRWIELDSVIIQWEGRAAILCFAGDITDLKKAEEALAASQVQLSDAMDLARMVYWRYDLATEEFIFNDPFYALYGTTAEQEGGYRMAREEYGKRFFHPDDLWLFAEAAEKRKHNEEREFFNDIEHRVIRKDGQVRYLLSRIRVTKDEKGCIVKYFGANQDITERKLLEEKLEAISISDELTGLYNRRGFFTLGEQQLRVALRTKAKLLLFFADLDGLKWINDVLGHREGDEAIVSAAKVLKETFRESDIIARMGGDEFAVLAVGPGDADGAISRLKENIARFGEEHSHPWSLSLSVGTACLTPGEPSALEALIARADAAMYEEKQKKKQRETG